MLQIYKIMAKKIDDRLAKVSRRALVRPFLKKRIAVLSQEAIVYRGNPDVHGHAYRLVASFIAIFFMAAIIWFLGVRIGEYMQRPTDLYHGKDVFNLTTEKVRWDVFYGESPDCDGMPCHLEPDYPADKFTKRMILPAREFPLLGYKHGQKIYLRSSFRIPAAVLAQDTPLVFHSLYIWAENYQFYLNGHLLEEGSAEMLNITLPKRSIAADGHVDIGIWMDPGNLPYQGIANRRDLAIGPKAKFKQIAYSAEDMKTTLYLWFLLPKITFCLVFSLLFLGVPRTKGMFPFIVFAFLSSCEIYFSSEYAQKMLMDGVNWSLVGLLCRNCSFLFFFQFVYEFFQRRHIWPRRAYAVSLPLIIVGSLVIFFYMHNERAVVAAELLGAILKPLGVIYGAYEAGLAAAFLTITQKNAFRARIAGFLCIFFTMATLPIFYNSYHILSDIMGWSGNSTDFILGWNFDLVFFTILAAITAMEFGMAITAKERIKTRLQAVEEGMDLAHSVQQLLMPRSLEGQTRQFAFQFFYDPAEKMAGDWLTTWRTADGAIRLMIGDVVGKGPQAALAVSAIMAAISESKQADLDVPACVTRINARLLDLFKGHVNTTFACLVIHPAQQDVELFGAGIAGWFRLLGNEASYIPMRGSLLGGLPDVKLDRTVFQNVPRDTFFFMFTDGCLEGSRAMKALQRRLMDAGQPKDSFADLKNAVIAVGMDSVREDDKTLLFVKKVA